jgi:hypothetical protein
MKLLKKISLVYLLQIFAVILLFGYAVSSPANKTKEAITDGIMPLEINKVSLVKAEKDSLLPVKLNVLWGVYTAKTGE